MGVDTGLIVYAANEPQAREGCRAAFERLAELEDVMSDYRPTSELMRLCAQSGDGPVKVSEDLWRVLSFGQEVADRSGGAFDMTVGPLSKLWRAARKSGKLPEASAVAEAKSRVGYEKLILDPKERTARLTVKGMTLDLGGIAKGDAGDQAIQVLRKHGIRSALYAAGGDIVASDAPPGEQGWRIAMPMKKEGILHAANCAVSTSGDTNQYLEIGGKRYSHVVDPRTGYGLTTHRMVTVIAPDGLTSDPVSKAAAMLTAGDLKVFLTHYPHVKVYVR